MVSVPILISSVRGNTLPPQEGITPSNSEKKNEINPKRAMLYELHDLSSKLSRLSKIRKG